MRNLTVKYMFNGASLVPIDAENAVKQNIFLKNSLKEGDVVECYMTVVEDTSEKTAGQLAKIHACIRDLAKFTGHDFEDMKHIIKKKAGLYDPASNSFKSFSECNKSELSEAIQVSIGIGNDIGYFMH